MGTDVVQPVANWKISDPDMAGNVYLDWTGAGGEREHMMLGQRDAVADAMADWLGRIDFEAGLAPGLRTSANDPLRTLASRLRSHHLTARLGRLTIPT